MKFVNKLLDWFARLWFYGFLTVVAIGCVSFFLLLIKVCPLMIAVALGFGLTVWSMIRLEKMKR